MIEQWFSRQQNYPLKSTKYVHCPAATYFSNLARTGTFQRAIAICHTAINTTADWLTLRHAGFPLRMTAADTHGGTVEIWPRDGLNSNHAGCKHHYD